MFIEIYTYINEVTPLVFVISQRGEDIITPKIDEYTKDGKLEIGKRNNQQSEEEEEEEEGMVFSVRKLHKLSLL